MARWWLVPLVVLVVILAGPLLGLFKIDTFGAVFTVGGLVIFFYPMTQAFYFKAIGGMMILAGILLWMDVWSISGVGGF